MMKLIVSPEVAALRICVAMARFRGAKVSNRSNPLETRKKEALGALCAIDIEAHPVLAAYRELHRLAGVDGVVPPAQHLISLAKAKGRVPNINTVVDCYNLVSAQTGFSIGAHDCAHLRGDVAFRITGGGERYWPLGEPKDPDFGFCGEPAITRHTSAYCADHARLAYRPVDCAYRMA